MASSLHTDDPAWYKDAIFYELHVRAFNDSNGDGIGDIQNLRISSDVSMRSPVTSSAGRGMPSIRF